MKELLHLKYPCDGFLSIKLPHFDHGDLNSHCGPSLITSHIRTKSSKSMHINGWLIHNNTIFIFLKTLAHIITFRNLPLWFLYENNNYFHHSFLHVYPTFHDFSTTLNDHWDALYVSPYSLVNKIKLQVNTYGIFSCNEDS